MQEEAEKAQTFQLEGNAWEGNLLSVCINTLLGGGRLSSATSRDRSKLCLSIKRPQNFSVYKKPNSGIGYSERMSSLHPWRYSKFNWVQTWTSCCCSSVYWAERVVIDISRGPAWFCELCFWDLVIPDFQEAADDQSQWHICNHLAAPPSQESVKEPQATLDDTFPASKYQMKSIWKINLMCFMNLILKNKGILWFCVCISLCVNLYNADHTALNENGRLPMKYPQY